MAKQKQFDMSDIEGIRSTWKPSEGIDWDKIQRMRFMNADQEIAPDDKYTARELNERDTYTRE
jgi:hypothetical protein|tara:strand:+ start:15933 stop:16121 length:189 start_codon:yes stop_codon:yes gene_type:complete